MSFRFVATALLGTLLLAGPAGGQQSSDSTRTTQKRPTRLDELVTTATRTSQTVGSNPFAVTAVTRADLVTSSAPSVPNLVDEKWIDSCFGFPLTSGEFRLTLPYLKPLSIPQHADW